MHQTIQDLLNRSNRLGADKRVTNFAGGNTSAKLSLPDPVTGLDVRVLAVKGSGGDLGTLTESGLALVDLDRVLQLENAHKNGVHEDDIVAMYDYCRFGEGGAVPSIDTPLHAFIDANHVDHLHPDSMIALACAADGQQLVQDCYGDEVGWTDWKRPGFELGLELARFQQAHPKAKGAMMGGHGMICWADTADRCEELSLRLIRQAEDFLSDQGSAEPFGPVRPGFEALPSEERAAIAADLGPFVRKIAVKDRWMIGSFTDAPEVLDFMASSSAPRLCGLGTSCPDHFLRTKVRPLVLDLPTTASPEERLSRLGELHQQYRLDYAEYYNRFADSTSPAMRGADPAIVLVPGVGMWSFGTDAQTAQVAGEFYINAINVMRGAEAVSTYAPISDEDKFSIEYWLLEERKLQLKPPAPPLQGRVALVTGGASGIGRATVERLSQAGACVVVADLDLNGADKVVEGLPAHRGLAVHCDVTEEGSVKQAFDTAAMEFGAIDIVVNSAGFARSASVTETTVEDWDQLSAVLARGSFLVSRQAATHMSALGRGGDIVHIVSKNGVVAGPANVAYGSAKAAQAHMVRLLAAELGEHQIRVNGINPDGVVRGSGIFTGEWLESRAASYGVEADRLGEFYAGRTLLGQEILPEHIAEGVYVLVSGSLSQTTGHLIPIDGGLAPAFLR